MILPKTFQDIKFIHTNRINKVRQATTHNTECNNSSRLCRFKSMSNELLRNFNILNGDVNNNQQETEPLLHNTHDHHRICSCLPQLFFNCCFLVSWTLFIYLFIYFSLNTKKNQKPSNCKQISMKFDCNQ